MAHHRLGATRYVLMILAMLLVFLVPSGMAETPAEARGGGERLVVGNQPELGDTHLSDYDCSAQSEIPQAECEALTALYTATSGESWWIRSNWLQNDTPSSWYGVTVAGGHVTELYLPVNNLSGSLPAQLGNLTELRVLEMDTNDLSGTIPVALGNLTKLESLNLAYNDLTGAIPSELGNLTNLEDLHLTDNLLSGSIPPELGLMTHLTDLVLKGNNLSGSIPASLTGLADLYYVDLSDNGLSGGIPSQLWANPSLAWVVLNDNQFSGSVPPGLGALSQLVHVDLSSNSLTGSVPADLSSATTLQHLDLGGNGLTGGVPEGLGSLTLLTHLDLSGNPLAGSVPGALAGCLALEFLNCSNASLTGTLPEALGTLIYLQTLDLSSNALTGPIPQSLGALTRVETLALDNNWLSGEMPATMGNMTSLQTLNASHNQLEGSIPSELGSLSGLRVLDLSHNQLSGEPPSIWGGLSSLETLHLNDNSLSGPFPATLSANNALERLSLANNGFGGEIPASLADMTSLADLNLGGNALTGVIPSQIGSLNRLNRLVLRSNVLVGPIPQSVTMLTSLSSADLAYNRLATTDTGISAFLASKDPDWNQTQTVPPTNVRVLDVEQDGLWLGWTPIVYTGDMGHYRVLVSTMPGGPYNLADVTSNKLQSGIHLTGLDIETTYYVVVQTVTPAHDDQASELVSEYSAEIAATTSVPENFDCDYVTEVPCAECEALEALYIATDGANWQRKTNWLQTTAISTWEGVTVSDGHVTALALARNDMTGALPPMLSNLGMLHALYLDHNALSGQIPSELGSLVHLVVLYLSGNDLTGEIPADLGAMGALEMLQLQENQLSGQIPPELGSLAALTSADLSQNQLSGAIPSELGNLSALQRLDLHANSLTGNLPSTLGDLSNLMSLSVGSNALSGDLPAALTHLTALGSQWWATVDLGYNRLTASDAALIDFLAVKDPDWSSTQTVAPTDLAVEASYSGSVRLGWTPIDYVEHEGRYQVSLASAPEGPWTVHGATPSKSADTYLVDGLESNETLYFRVRTSTHPHDLQSNELWSEATQPVQGTTISPAQVGMAKPIPWISLYGPEAGAWTEQNIFPRMLADVNGDGRDDIVAFGSRASYVSLSTGASFGPPSAWLIGLGVAAGGWTEQNLYPRTTGDVNGDGLADLVALGKRTVYVSLSDGASFGPIETWIEDYRISPAGWTEQNLMPRHVGDVNGDGLDDIVGFGNSATYVSLSNGEVFLPPEPWIYAYGPDAGGWTDQNTFPRFIADVNGDGMDDVVAFGDTATYVSLSEGNRFGAVTLWISCYGVTAGNWSEQSIFPRMLGDVNGDGRADIIACGEYATYVSLSTGIGFQVPVAAVSDFALVAGGWSDQNTFPRVSGDVNGDGQDDLVGFGNRATYVSLADW